jgi:hypothetical protein
MDAVYRAKALLFQSGTDIEQKGTWKPCEEADMHLQEGAAGVYAQRV